MMNYFTKEELNELYQEYKSIVVLWITINIAEKYWNDFNKEKQTKSDY